MPEAGDAAERRRMARKHIFVVTGAPDFLDLVRALLQDADFNVTTTNYVPETFDMVAALDPTLLIVDLEIGRQAGWDLLEALQAGAQAASPAVAGSKRAATPLRPSRMETDWGGPVPPVPGPMLGHIAVGESEPGPGSVARPGIAPQRRLAGRLRVGAEQDHGHAARAGAESGRFDP